jgi:TetR/AcrR family transcriptional regulator
VSNPSSALALQRVALEQFSLVGFGGASLGSIAQAAGLSKSSVLYHYASKEALLAAAIEPAVDALDEVIQSYPYGGDRSEHDQFVERFIDFLLEHRLAVHLFVNQGQVLDTIPAVQRANDLVHRFSETVAERIPSVQDRIRFGVAIGGAAYILVAAANWSDAAEPSAAEAADARAALIDTVASLLRHPEPAH